MAIGKNLIKKSDIVKTATLPKKISHPYSITKNYNFSIHETRIFARLLQRIKTHQVIGKRINPDLFNKVKLTFFISDLTVGNDYNEVKEALKDLKHKDVTLNTVVSNGSDGSLNTSLITSYYYAFDNSIVDIEMNNDWYIYLSNIVEGGHTSYLAETSYGVSNEYHYSMYLYISHWYKKGKFEGVRINSIDKLREIFKIPANIYPSTTDFINRVVIPAKKMLDKVADKSFNYELIRLIEGATRGKGAKIIAIDLKFYDTSKTQIPHVTYDAKRSAKVINSWENIYKLSDLEKAKLGGYLKKYGVDWVAAIEKEERHFLQKQPDFLSAISNIVNKRSKG